MPTYIPTNIKMKRFRFYESLAKDDKFERKLSDLKSMAMQSACRQVKDNISLLSTHLRIFALKESATAYYNASVSLNNSITSWQKPIGPELLKYQQARDALKNNYNKLREAYQIYKEIEQKLLDSEKYIKTSRGRIESSTDRITMDKQICARSVVEIENMTKKVAKINEINIKRLNSKMKALFESKKCAEKVGVAEFSQLCIEGTKEILEQFASDSEILQSSNEAKQASCSSLRSESKKLINGIEEVKQEIDSKVNTLEEMDTVRELQENIKDIINCNTRNSAENKSKEINTQNFSDRTENSIMTLEDYRTTRQRLGELLTSSTQAVNGYNELLVKFK